LSFHTEPLSTDQVIAAIDGNSVDNAAVADWQDLLIQLGDIHPAKYGTLVEAIDLLGILAVKPLRDQAQALRFVSFVDRLYDRSVPVINSGIRLDAVFSSEMLSGGYRKKYFRCLSRLAALAAEGVKVVG
jgi:cell division protein ZapE